jgi:hypothetical protein
VVYVREQALAEHLVEPLGGSIAGGSLIHDLQGGGGLHVLSLLPINVLTRDQNGTPSSMLV